MSYAFKDNPGPFKHQREFVENHPADEGYCLFWEQGTGKSRGLLDNAAALYEAGEIDALFVVSPNGLHRNLVTQQVVHLPDRIADGATYVFYRTDAAETTAHREEIRGVMRSDPKRFRILSMSYDGIMTEAGRAVAKEFLTSNRVLYGLDESARIKNPDAARTKRILASGQLARYRRPMTGTPVSQAPWDVYTQVRFALPDFWKQHGLDSVEALKATFGEWDTAVRRVRVPVVPYMERQNASLPTCLHNKALRRPDGKLIVNSGMAMVRVPTPARGIDGLPVYRNLEQLRDILRPISSRVLKEDVFDLPPKMYTRLDHDLTSEQQQAYDELRELGFTQVRDGIATAGMALKLMLRMQQIVCGYLPVDDVDPDAAPIIHRFDVNPRLDLLREMIPGIAHQGIVWARFRSDVDQICDFMKREGISHARYDGTLSDDECAESERRFHAGDAQWFVATQSKGGEGLTLVEAKTVIYYSNSFKLTERLQSEDRAHRFGQDTRVQYIDLAATGTIDERLIDVLIGKREVANLITGDAFRAWLQPAQGTLDLGPAQRVDLNTVL